MTGHWQLLRSSKNNSKIDLVVKDTRQLIGTLKKNVFNLCSLEKAQEIMSTLITVFFWTQGTGQRAWIEILKKWKTDGRKHATGIGIQAVLYIVYQKEKET